MQFAKVTLSPKSLWLTCLAGLCSFAAMLSTPAAAQETYICGGGPGPGELQVGMTPSGNGVGALPLCTRPANLNPPPDRPTNNPRTFDPGPSRFYQPDYFSAIATHSGSTGFWASARNATLSGAELNARLACQKDMGEGCFVVSQTNGVMALAYDYDGSFVIQRDVDENQARIRLHESCSKYYTGCAFIAIFRSDQTFVSNAVYTRASEYENIISPARPDLARKKYGAVAWVLGKGNDNAFVATGHQSIADATAAAMTACDTYYTRRFQCELATSASNGVLLFVNTDKKVNFIPHQTLAQAEVARENWCKEIGARSCASVRSFDVATSGLTQVRARD
jgi:Domain of unknown function (DUF4189)